MWPRAAQHDAEQDALVCAAAGVAALQGAQKGLRAACRLRVACQGAQHHGQGGADGAARLRGGDIKLLRHLLQGLALQLVQ